MVAGKGPKAKTLIRQDGTQIAAQVGMVDRSGVMFNVVDVGSKYMEFHPMSWIAQDMEAEIERLKSELDRADAHIAHLLDRYERSVDLSDELLACGAFPRGTKIDFNDRAWRLRKDFREARERWQTGA